MTRIGPIAALASLLASTAVMAADKNQADPELHCGAYCLYLGLKALDFPIKDYKALEKELGQPSSLGYSMDQLANAARKQGAHSLGVSTSLENLKLRPNRLVCIALLKQGHYVNLYDISDDRAYLIDPPSQREVGLDAFRAAWTGKALLISDRPLADESSLARRWSWPVLVSVALAFPLAILGTFYLVQKKRHHAKIAAIFVLIGLTQGCGTAADPALKVAAMRIEPPKIDLGALRTDRDGQAKASFRITNRGTADLRIESVQASCGCTVVQAPPSLIGPGRSASLSATIRPGIQPGPRSSILTIQCNDPVASMVHLPITWNVVARLTCDPNEIDLGKLRPGEKAERRISVQAAAGIDLRKFQAQTALTGFSFEWEPSAPEMGARRRVLIARFTAGPSEGDGGGMILVAGKSPEDAIVVPVKWRTVSRISVHPRALFSSNVKSGDELIAHVVLQSEEDQVFGVKSVTFENRACPFTIVSPGPRSKAPHLRLALAAPGESGPHRLVLRITTDVPNLPPISVPWSIVVR